ncbi:hypothetical protein [uncultured Jannaschia sp.]|uniref:hypothetical protein n=1 Tax=uncultured Jannaschia sp. TaxID=293347 RepID=UPI0026290AD5|nr:hypothetical protein [uncultured Jannaschia sp.]
MRAIPILITLPTLVALAACAPSVPESAIVQPSGYQAGFDTPAAGRRGSFERMSQDPFGFDTPATTQTEAERLAGETRNVLGQPPLAANPLGDMGPVSAPAPLPDAATSPVPAPGSTALTNLSASSLNVGDLDRDNPAISNEQDFEAVSAQRGIAADAERLRIAREQYRLATPTELERPDSTGPNIFAYALGPAHPVGTAAYRRGLRASATRAAQQCAAYSSPDLAQEAFLEAGGPSRDRLGLDPDGDGNACDWNPAVVRTLVQSN